MPVVGRDYLHAQAEIDHTVQKQLPNVNVDDLNSAWADILKRAKLNARHPITRETLSVREFMTGILRKLHNRRFMEFSELFDDMIEQGEGRAVLVINFIAMLELSRESLIEITQAEAYAPIYVRLSYQPQ